MKQVLLVLTLGLALHAGPILDASGTGTYSYGEGTLGTPQWTFAVSGFGCDEVAWNCWSGSDAYIDGEWFLPGDYTVSLQPLAGMQYFIATGADAVSQGYETFGVITSNGCDQATGVCTEVFAFSAPVSEQTDSVAAAVPEPSTWLLVLAAVALVAIRKRRKTLSPIPVTDPSRFCGAAAYPVLR